MVSATCYESTKCKVSNRHQLNCFSVSLSASLLCRIIIWVFFCFFAVLLFWFSASLPFSFFVFPFAFFFAFLLVCSASLLFWFHVYFTCLRFFACVFFVVYFLKKQRKKQGRKKSSKEASKQASKRERERAISSSLPAATSNWFSNRAPFAF